MDKRGFNECYFGIRNTKNFLIKVYRSRERFKSEIKFQKIFKENGFLCPDIIEYDEKQRFIIFEYIKGDPCSLYERKLLLRCVDQMAVIRKSLTNTVCNFKTSNSSEVFMIDKILKGISTINQISIKISKITKLLENYFFWGVFKDCKPMNWIFSEDEKLFIIDFDYVKIGHALSDLAQLLSYVLVVDFSLDIEIFVAHFLEYSNINMPIELGIELVFILILYSNTRKVLYISNCKLLKKFQNLNNFILEKI